LRHPFQSRPVVTGDARGGNIQTGYLYHYAIVMILGLVGLLTIFVAI